MSEIFYLFNYFIRQSDRIIPILMPENEKNLKNFPCAGYFSHTSQYKGMKKSILVLLVAVLFMNSLSAVAMRFSLETKGNYAHFDSSINTFRAEGAAKLEIGEELADRHDIMASISYFASGELDSNQVWTRIPPQLGLSLGISYSYDFTQKFGLRSEIGVNLANNRLTENSDSSFYAGVTPYISLLSLPESYSSYEMIFPIEMAFSASRFEFKLGIGISLHIASRYGEEYAG